MPRARPKNENTRESILAVSVRLFAEQGYDGVAMRQIANEVEVTLPTIYHHFGSKEELFKAVETEIYGGHAASLIQELHADADPEERLRRFMTNLMDSFEQDPTYFKLVQRNLIDARQENHEFLVDLSLQGVFNELKKLLNEFRPGSGETVAPVTIFSAIVGFQTMRPAVRLLKGYRFAGSDAKVERQTFMDGVIQGIDGGGSAG